MNEVSGFRKAGECQQFCVRGRFDHHAAKNLSSKKMANWVFAATHSRGCIYLPRLCGVMQDEEKKFHCRAVVREVPACFHSPAQFRF
jgi:hypothetical protein